MSLKGAVEAALFAAGGPIQLKDLAQLVGSPSEDVEEMLGTLRTDYKGREGGLEVVRHAGGLWVLQVPKQYTALVQRLVPPDLDKPLMKTLSVIALLQPCTQAKVVERRGQNAYSHVKELAKKGFITREPDGNSFLLRTTPEFARRFRLKDDPEAIRTALKERAEVTPDQPDIEPTSEPLSAEAQQVLAQVEAETPATPAELESELVAALAPLQEEAPAPTEATAEAESPVVNIEPPVVAEEHAPRALPLAVGEATAEAPAEELDEEPATDAEGRPRRSKVSRLADHASLRQRVLHGNDRSLFRIPRARKA